MSVDRGDHRYCTFVVGELLMGVAVPRVREVIRPHPRTRVPLVSPLVGGLINLRGEIVTTLDLRRRLQLPPLPDGVQPMNVVVHTSDGPVSLLVDAIGDVLDVGGTGIEPVPPTLRGPCRELISHIHKLDGALLLVVDIDVLLDIPALRRESTTTTTYVTTGAPR